ncbi:MAG: GatB/YqeY domain-containing protein [Lachnospiraceae bacterium]|nr:GatB/YqeY domain-containing protein [Lachnospiraceae bacterium]MBR6357110.1 GatB/YqeY domain-containing protein [Lachnospiraceae bacterium]
MTFEKLQQDMIAAMKARDADRKEVLSNLVSAAKKAAIDKQCRDNITEEIVDAAILKELKTAKEQIDTCPPEREELMAKYKYNYDVIASYAPQMMSEKEIRATLEKDFADVIATKNKGQIMKTIMPAFKGKADGKLINQIVADLCK